MGYFLQKSPIIDGSFAERDLHTYHTHKHTHTLFLSLRTIPKSTLADIDEDYHTALHEITHILGFSEALYPYFRDR